MKALRWYPLLFKLVGGGMWALLGALAVLASTLTTQHSAVVSVFIILLRNGLPYLGSFFECAPGSTSLLRAPASTPRAGVLCRAQGFRASRQALGP